MNMMRQQSIVFADHIDMINHDYEPRFTQLRQKKKISLGESEEESKRDN